MGIFDAVGGAPMPGLGNYFNEGVYVGVINVARQGESTQGKGPFVAIEATILETVVAFPPRKSWIDGSLLPASNKPGEVCANVVMMRNLSAPGNIKGFLAGTTGLPPEQINGAVAEKCFAGDGTTLRGTKVLIRAALTKTRAGKPFTKVLYEAATPEAIAKVKAAAAAGHGAAAE